MSVEPHSILLIAGCVASAITLILTVRMTYAGLQARKALLQKLAHDAAFLNELRHFQEVQDADDKMLREEIARMDAFIRNALAGLNSVDRARIEASLYQPSSTGRKRFVRKLVHDAAQLQVHHSAATY